MPRAATIRHPDFIRKFVEYGLSHREAKKAYRAMMAMFADGIGSKSNILLYGVGTLQAVPQRPRRHVMGVVCDKEGYRRVRREFIVGSRIRYRFKIHDEFGRRHDFYA